jgi:hypothetical protein
VVRAAAVSTIVDLTRLSGAMFDFPKRWRENPPINMIDCTDERGEAHG